MRTQILRESSLERPALSSAGDRSFRRLFIGVSATLTDADTSRAAGAAFKVYGWDARVC